jgi:cell fate regulator YaaT (PSP1 superfamily)
MPPVVGVRFKDSGKIYHFDPQNMSFAAGDWVIVETVRGPEMGRITTPPVDVAEDQLFGEIKPVVRPVTQQDLDQWRELQQYEPEALGICAQKVAEHKLPMHLIKAEYNFDGSRLTFFFTADHRVDFRALVRDLARTFRTRIELRQIGPRDEAKLLGGIGPCGRLLCCATFLPDFARVSIKMAKDQDLPLNPSKISGVCGRLLCCLSYEQDQYLEIKEELPQRGDWVQTARGPGEVVAVNIVKETVTVELTDGDTVDCTAAEILEVSQRVAAEAQARNAEGITPVARERLGAQKNAVHDELLLGDDPDLLQELEALEEAPAWQPNPRRQQDATSEQPAVRPEAALGLSLSRKASAPQQAAVDPRSQSGATPELVDDDVVEPQPERASRSRSRRRKKRRSAEQQSADVPQAALAPRQEAQPSAPAVQSMQKEGGRQRKHKRGRGGKQ